MTTYNKVPGTVDAQQFVGNFRQLNEISEWVAKDYPWLDENPVESGSFTNDDGIYIDPTDGRLVINSVAGAQKVFNGDYVVKEQGTIYVLHPSIFEKIYTTQPVSGSSGAQVPFEVQRPEKPTGAGAAPTTKINTIAGLDYPVGLGLRPIDAIK